MSSRTSIEHGVGWLYNQVTGDEDARVCKEIPDEACVEQPRNFFAYLFANLCNKISDELVSARITLPWLFSLLGVPASFAGFIVPIREAFILLPQLFVAAYVRALPHRKIVWIIGASISAFMLFVMAVVASNATGIIAGWLLIITLIIYSLARGLCSVAAKDVLGKTVSKTRRGRLMGYSAFLAGIATLLIGLLLQTSWFNVQDVNVLLGFIIVAGVMWIIGLGSFKLIIEPAGATEGGGNAFIEAIKNLGIIFDDKAFRQYLISRVLLVSIALVIPFFVIIAQQELDGALKTLGVLIILNGLANTVSAPLIGKFADDNSRNVMALGAGVGGVVGVFTWCWSRFFIEIPYSEYVFYLMFFLITLTHGAIRLGRKVYLVDMANTNNRAKYVAVSNTVIGVAMLLVGSVGVIAELFSVATAILLLSLTAIASSFYIISLKNVSG